MSRKRVSASAVLDGLQRWGDECVVAPAKLLDGRPAPIEAGRFEGFGWALGRMVATFVVLTLILLVYLWAPPGASGFIYADF